MLDYFSSIESSDDVCALEKRMQEYYSHSNTYYGDISYAAANWNNENDLAYSRMLQITTDQDIVDIGCGNSAMLTSPEQKVKSYSGCDFSKELMEESALTYPESDFRQIKKENKIPFPSDKFDVVMSIFVLEHVVNPRCFLKEIVRCCKRGGKIAIYCPDYWSRRRISSQLLGFSIGCGREKFRDGKYLDGILTGVVNRITMPLYFYYKLRKAHINPVFLINRNPACFSRPFYIDADAVYVTHYGEIKKTLSDMGCEVLSNSDKLAACCRKQGNMFVEAIKK